MARPTEIFVKWRVSRTAASLVAASAALVTSPAIAGVTDFTVFFSSENEQTSATSVSNLSYYFSSFADVQSTSDYTAASVTAPTAVPYGMLGPYSGPPPYFIYESSGLTLSQLNTTYPSGTYTLNTSGANDVLVSLTVGTTPEYATPPMLTAASYDGLAGLDPSGGYTFSFDAFTTPPSGYIGIIFFTLTDVATGQVVYSNSTEDLSTTSFSVPGNDFAPDTEYVEELVFSTRDEVTDPTCVSEDPTQCPSLGEIGYDSRTEAYFTTGVPEPSTWLMMVLGFAGLGWAGYWRSRRLA